jgi:hypothetical protein
MTDLQIFDIKNEPTEKAIFLFKKFANEIEKSKCQKRKSNYLGLVDSYNQYASFTVIISGEECIAFSALQVDHFWPAGRVLTRTYYSSDVRKKNMRPREFPSLASKYMLPIQIDKAKKLGLSYVFVSFESQRHKSGLFPLRFAQGLCILNPDQRWVLLPGLYNTCRLLSGSLNNDKSCLQHIVSLQINPGAYFPLPKHS